MGRIGWGEFLIIVIIAAIVLGPEKLPELGQALGKAVRSVKKYVSETANELADVDELREIQKDVRSIQEDVTSIGRNLERSITEPEKPEADAEDIQSTDTAEKADNTQIQE